MSTGTKIFVVSGPSGAGKGTLTCELLLRVPSLVRAVTATTRRPRPGEVNGVDYFFLTNDQFDAYIARKEFLEWATVHGNRYGTLREAVIKQLEMGYDVVLVIDVQGAISVKERMPDAVLIFVEPPSMDVLIDRLRGRNTETDEELRIRMDTAIAEMKLAKTYDYVVINDDVKRATDELVKIVESEQART